MTPGKQTRKRRAQSLRKNVVMRLHASIARELGVEILSGRYQPGALVPGEVEGSERFDVSRTAYREAIRTLAAKGLVHSRTRTGTRVSSPERWQLLDPDVLSWVFAGDPAPEVLHGIFELRSLIEPAAAELAATRRKQWHLDRMHRALDTMAQFTLHAPEGRHADEDFHGTLIRATCNPFLISLSNSITAAVHTLTAFKVRLSALERDPFNDHLRVYEAIAAMSPKGARAAMSELIRLAIMDMPVTGRPKYAAGGRFLVELNN
jgi:DNA-binding FadR family transcriptional regulator